MNRAALQARMSDELNAIYVICRHNGTEGHGAPIQASEDLDEAKALLKLMCAIGYTTFKLYAVPIWPDADGQEYRTAIEVQP